jgi:hypothetical protein
MEFAMNDKQYEVVYPVGRSTVKVTSQQSHISNLSGKTICGAGHTFRGDEAINKIVELLQKQYHDIKFIPNTELPEEVSTKEEIANLQNILQEKGCDVLLSGIGC